MTIRGDILRQAADLTERERDGVYGDPLRNMTCAAELKAVFRKFVGTKYSPAHNEAIEDMLDKISRVATGQYHADNYIDAVAYIAIAGEIQLNVEQAAIRESDEIQRFFRVEHPKGSTFLKDLKNPAKFAHDYPESRNLTGNNAGTDTYKKPQK